LVSEEDRPAMGRLWTWNLGVLAEEARALSNGLMFWDAEPLLYWEDLKRLAFGRGKPLGNEEGFFWYFRFVILQEPKKSSIQPRRI
jgi:hypothetical protein